MQGKTATTRHGVTGKRSTQTHADAHTHTHTHTHIHTHTHTTHTELKQENLFRKNLKLISVC